MGGRRRPPKAGKTEGWWFVKKITNRTRKKEGFCDRGS